MKFRILFLTIIILTYNVNFCLIQESKNSKNRIINDFSQLNETKISDFVNPTSYEELASILKKAKKENLKISISGIRHSLGGHAFYSNAIVINLKNLNKIINLDLENKIITVQTGASWKEVQEYLNPHNLAVKIMQFANMFTIGGALSVNANGIDPNYGPLIESVRSIKIMLADGNIVKVSRSENYDLFKLAIGGYGLFGIILEAELEIVENSLYRRKVSMLSLKDYVKHIQNLKNDKSIGFHFGNLVFKPISRNLFSKVMCMDFKKIDEKSMSLSKKKQLKKLRKENFVGLKKWGISSMRGSLFGKSTQWIPEYAKNGNIISRNNVMSPAVSHMYCHTNKETYLLQEYFIPVDNILTFITTLEDITKKLKFNLMHVALRFIPKNIESFLSYTLTDRIGVVLYFSQEMTKEDSKKTEEWTKYLIDSAIKLKGAYYLPIQLHADKNQIKEIYPEIGKFFAFKKQHDPEEIFMNHFYKKYT